MGTRVFIKNSKFIFLFSLLTLSLFPLSAQNGSASFRMELRFVQRLTWTGDAYAMRYEVIIEKAEQGHYSRFYQGFTENEFIEVSLPPGNYRFQVIPYDFFNSPVHGAQWVNFEVLSGGDKLAEGDHEVILINPGDETSRTEIKISTPNPSAAGVIPQDETTAVTEQKNITAPAAANHFDIYLGALYLPLLPLYNDNEFFFGENVSLTGAGLRISVVSAKQNFVSSGLELFASWRIYETIQAITVDFNFLSQIRLLNAKTASSASALNIRLGAGVSLLSDIPPVSTTGQYSLHANIGLSFLVLVTPKMYIEIGADYSQFFTLDHFGFFRPWIGIGVRL